MIEVAWVLGCVYVGVGLYKLVLVLTTLWVAVGVHSMLRPNESFVKILFLYTVGILLGSILAWPIFLYVEKWDFFRTYDPEEVRSIMFHNINGED